MLPQELTQSLAFAISSVINPLYCPGTSNPNVLVNLFIPLLDETIATLRHLAKYRNPSTCICHPCTDRIILKSCFYQ